MILDRFEWMIKAPSPGPLIISNLLQYVMSLCITAAYIYTLLQVTICGEMSSDTTLMISNGFDEIRFSRNPEAAAKG